ncbi:hypothetical protein Dalk_1288 [Desulfatibacillum aliphaticivorans]|uniref:Uncharacterized protein n=1 Tax=Desulfatibacillum aliphaticivorans TaxID=218208 RepID=B8F9P5_DESAL|nr:hypothetical protein [Desulfatibacillum aliphaticivorans]ACL02991.1 hypothetical protein Dalk_1288 [Desulfatibacillum aliphaticivorans]
MDTPLDYLMEAASGFEPENNEFAALTKKLNFKENTNKEKDFKADEECGLLEIEKHASGGEIFEKSRPLGNPGQLPFKHKRYALNVGGLQGA